MRLTKVISVAAAAALATSAVAISAYAEPMTQDDISAQVFLMGNDSWNWYSVEVKSVNGVLSADVNAADLIAGTKKDSDSAVGQFGIQIGNPIGKDKSQFKDGEVAKELAPGTKYTITYTLKKADGTVIAEGAVKESDFEANGVYGQAVNIEILANGASWEELEAFGTMKFEAVVAWEAPAAEETTAEETTAEETTDAAETTVEETVPADTEAAVEEDFADDIEADIEEEAAEEEEADLDINFDNGILIASNCDADGAWSQAVSLMTYNNIAEGDVPGENPFDVSILNENNVVVVNYEADTAPELIIQSWSGGTEWAKVPANEELSQPGVAVYTYDSMTSMYGSDDFSTVDAVHIGDTGSVLHVDSAYVISVDALNGSEGAEGDYKIEADVSADEAAPADTAAPVVEETTSAKTGNASAAALAVIAVAAGAAAVAARKRK